MRELSFEDAEVSHLEIALEALQKYDYVGLYNAEGAQKLCKIFTTEMEEFIKKKVS